MTESPVHEDLTSATNSFINEIYKNGYWQLVMFLLIEESIMYTGSFIAFSGTFTGAHMDYTCKDSLNMSYLRSTLNQCQVWNERINKSEPCRTGYIFHANKDFIKSSLKADFQLICDRRYLDGISQSCVMAGFFIGGIVGPLYADKYGRRYVLFICLFIGGSTGIAMAFVNNIYLFISGSLILGIMREVTMSTGFVYSLEFIPNYRQSSFGFITQLLWSGNITILGIMAYFIRDWRYLQLIGSFPILLSGFLLFLVPESPRWLIAMGQFDKLRYNKTHTSTFSSLYLQNISKENGREKEKSTQYSPLDIFRSKILFFWTLILTLSWMFIVLSYYGSTMLMINLPGNKYLSFILTCSLELPALLLTFLIIQKGRNMTMLIYCSVCAISFITVGFIDRERSVIILILSIVGKGTLVGLFYIIVVTSIYIYPTTIRSFGTGLPSAVGKLFAIIIPYFVRLHDIHKWIPTLIIGVSAFLIGLINLMYPDWVNKPLPETFCDLNALKKSTGIRFKKKTSNISI